MTMFGEEVQRIIAAARAVPLRILVWGPTQPGAGVSDLTRTAFDARVRVKRALIETFPRADVQFSEEFEHPQLLGPMSLLTAEAVHARVADLVLIIDAARGMQLELEHFVMSYPWFREKVFVFCPQFGSGSLDSGVYITLVPSDHIQTFSEREFNEDAVAERAVRIVQTYAVGKLLRE